MNKQYDIEQLTQFCAGYSNLSEPFLLDDGRHVCFTDCRFLLAVGTNLINGAPEKNDEGLTIPRIDFRESYDKELTLAALKEFERTLPTVPEEQLIRTQCPECKGRGVVIFNYHASSEQKYYDIEGECPVCNGDGMVEKYVETGKNIVDEDIFVNVRTQDGNKATYKYGTFRKLMKALEILGASKLHITHIGEREPLSFRVVGVDAYGIMATSIDDNKPKETIEI